MKMMPSKIVKLVHSSPFHDWCAPRWPLEGSLHSVLCDTSTHEYDTNIIYSLIYWVFCIENHVIILFRMVSQPNPRSCTSRSSSEARASWRSWGTIRFMSYRIIYNTDGTIVEHNFRSTIKVCIIKQVHILDTKVRLQHAPINSKKRLYMW